MSKHNHKVLVTGAGGFVGSHLVERLLVEGYSVRALVRYNSTNRAGWLDTLPADIRREIEIIAGDIRDAEHTAQAIHGCQWVFHLAALIAIPYSYHAPRSYVDTNITGTLNILHAALKQGAKVMHTSTSEVYGTAQYVPIDEAHPLQGQSPYSASKIGADMLAESFYRSFGLPVVTVRPFNTFGPRQSTRAIIPTVLTQLLNDRPEIEVGNLSPTRDLNYVQNTVDAFLTVARSNQGLGEVINFGTGKEISIQQLIEKLMELTGIQKKLTAKNERKRPDKSEVERLCCDRSKAQQLFDWTPRYSLAAGLTETIAWFQDHWHLYPGEGYTI